MASTKDKVTDALNEARILILGAQILLGFQFAAAFQSRFERFPISAQWLNALALSLMIVAVGLLMAPAPFHRLAEDGNDTPVMHRFTTRMSCWAPLPFALCIGIDVFVVANELVGSGGAAAAGGALGLLAISFWYGIEAMQSPRSELGHASPTKPEREEETKTSIHEKIKTMTTEARVILPGAQALLGFQFTAFLTDGFEKLPETAKRVHLGSLVLMAITIILLMAPAPYHRIVADGEDRPDVDRFGSRVMLCSLAPLAMGLAGDFYLVLGKVAGWSALAVAGALAAAVFLLGMWFGYPLLARRQRASH